MGSAISDNPYLIAGIALAAYTGGASMAAAVPATATAAAVPAVGFGFGTALATVGVAAQIQAGEHAAEAIKIDAKAKNREEEFAARDREIIRRKNLLGSLARQNVFSAAGGVESFTGTPGRIAEISEKEFERGQLTDVAMTGIRKRSTLAGASRTRSRARISAGASLIDYGQRLTQRG